MKIKKIKRIKKTDEEVGNNISEERTKKAVKISEKLGKRYSEKNIEKIEKKKDLYIKNETLKNIWSKIEFLWKKLREHETPMNVKIAIFGGFAYMILPIDLIPDWIPAAGFIDDAAVFLYIWKNVMPYLKEVTKDIVEEISSKKIKAIITDSYKKTIIRAVVVLLLNIIATVIVCFRPFGEIASSYVAGIIFFALFVYSIYRTVLKISRYGMITLGISGNIIKAKSLRTGIANYVRSTDDKMFQRITKAFKFADVVNQMTDIDLPSLEDVIHHFLIKFLKTIFLFVGLYAVYTVGTYWFLKPFLLNHYTNMTCNQIMIFPFWHLFNVIKHLFTK